ncbi:MAG: hypothetical protein ABS81_02240 [Pseudonocardia sp. SCN 72-86]|nr:MAG: hypothetical protein ABS81_02240 [Pseudonocardia sp. SCN 72-86]
MGRDTPPAELHCTLTVDAEPYRLGLVRHAVEVWLRAAGWSGRAATHIVFAVGEAVGNSIEHAYTVEPPGSVTVALTVEAADGCHERVRVVVTDRGRWRAGAPEPSRGNGLQLMETLVARVEVDTDAHGTRVTLVGEPMPRPRG